MTTLIWLRRPGKSAWALQKVGGRLFPMPFLDNLQALAASGIDPATWHDVPTVSYQWKSMTGGPLGYHFFVRTGRQRNVEGVVVSGAYGILETAFSSPDIACKASWENWWLTRPGESLRFNRALAG